MDVCYPDSVERIVTNEFNRSHRNCRIGQVKWKYRGPFNPNWSIPKTPPPQLPHGLSSTRATSPRFGEVWR